MTITLEDVTVEVPNKSLVHDVSFQAETNKVTGLVGSNGSGKSTVLKTISRITRPSSGDVALDNVNIWDSMNAHHFARRVAVLGQERDLEISFSVRDVVTSGRTPHIGSFSRLTKRDHLVIEAAVDRTSIEHLLGRDFASLSGGEKQRVLLARALSQEPQVLILDEPTNHLDVRAQFELLDLVTTLDLTVLIAIHDLTLAAQYCDQLVVLQNGRITAQGTPLDVLTPDVIADTFGVDSMQSTCPLRGTPMIALGPRSHDTRQ